MAGQEDWEARTLGEGPTAMRVYVHRLCGALIDMPLTAVHLKSCPAASIGVEKA